MNNILNLFIIGIILVPMLSTANANIEDLSLVLPTEQSLPETWTLSNIEFSDDRSVGNSDETTDVVARQYLLRDQVNENSLILVTLSINEFSSMTVSSAVFDDHTKTMAELDAIDMNITDETGSQCFGIIQNPNSFNEVSTISCSVDEFILVSSAQQNGVVSEDGNPLKTDKVSAAFATFLIKNLREFEHSVLIPDWIKNNAKWWSDETITDDEFVKAIEFLIKEKIISIKQGPSTDASSDIPPWVKTNAGWWSDGMISDKEFIQSIEYMVNNGIITV